MGDSISLPVKIELDNSYTSFNVKPGDMGYDPTSHMKSLGFEFCEEKAPRSEGDTVIITFEGDDSAYIKLIDFLIETNG